MLVTLISILKIMEKVILYDEYIFLKPNFNFREWLFVLNAPVMSLLDNSPYGDFISGAQMLPGK